MPSLPRGLYEELITEALEARLQQVGAQLHTARSLPLGRLAFSLHLARVVRHALDCLKDADRVAEGIALAQLVAMMYVGFKGIKPSADVGFDLSKEYEAACAVYQAKRG